MDFSPAELELPGFRFHPTEEELLEFYLKSILFGKELYADIIGFLNIYYHDPWELPGLARFGEREWYFFVPQDRKYGSGGRPNRTTKSGFWKATGSDRRIFSDHRKLIGLKKTLAFYRGRAPRGCKTNWIMNEYRHPDIQNVVLCKIYLKTTSLRVLQQKAAIEEAAKSLHSDTITANSDPSSSSPPTNNSSKLKVGGTYDEMRSSTIEKIVPPSFLLIPELQYSGDMIQGETHGEVSVEPNTLINEENIVTGVQCERIRAEENTLDVQYGITQEVLQQYWGMKLQDVANKLGVSRSTLKRIRKKYGIKRWHHQGSRKTSNHQDALNPPNENTDAHSRPKTTMTQDDSSITVKATDGECTWKFQLLHSARKVDLDKQLVERLNSPIGSFKIQYHDEEDEWISISCDADLKLCIDTCRSQGNTAIRMEIKKK